MEQQLEHEEAFQMVQKLVRSCYDLGRMAAQDMEDTDGFKAERERRDSLWNDVLDALHKEPATPPGECVLALQAEQELLAWLEKQLDKHTRARNIMDLRIESLADFRTATATVVAKMEEFIVLQ